MDKLVIAPVVQAVLRPASVARLVDLREHTDAGCLGCGGVIPPEDPNPATVVVGVSENTVLRVNFAHETCMASQIYDIDQTLDLPELLTSVSFVAYPILRAAPAFPRAMIVFEFAVTLVIEEAEGDHQKASFLKLGWEHVTDSWDRITASPVDGLLVRRRGDELVVDEEAGEILAFSNDTPPPGWWEVAAAEDACLLLYGSGLGLDRISMDRVNTALQASACAAATARVEAWAALEPITDPEETASLDQGHSEVSGLDPGAHFLAEADDAGREAQLYVTVYDSERRRCSAWFRLAGPGRDELEAAIERVGTSGAAPEAVAAGLEALANGDRQQAERVVRQSLGL
ncbi:MAG: hypothetical protein H0U84_04855 [Thermoleophilaceae bacterium]|nr:hypothetical protein [Thermoleophilaceae bacterium]